MADDYREEFEALVLAAMNEATDLWQPNCGDIAVMTARIVTDDLLASPVIARIRAEALRDAARDIEPDIDPESCTTIYDPWDVGDLLRARADRLSIHKESE